MNWTQIVTDLREVMTLQEIADKSGLKSKGTVHGIVTGAQTDVSYAVGVKLMEMHKKLMARKAAAAKRASTQ